MMPALFVTFAAMLVVSSLLVILHRNPVTSALFLVLAFCSLAGIYLVMHAEFLGMVQVIVYAGAIMVLFLFVIMYLNLGQDVEGGTASRFRASLSRRRRQPRAPRSSPLDAQSAAIWVSASTCP